MGMGSGGGGAVPPAGLSPLQQQQFNQGNQLINQNTPMANVAMQRNLQAQGALNNFMANRAKFNDVQMGWENQQAKWARGGLMAQGLGQVNRALSGPNLAPGIQARTAGRMGIGMDQTTQAALAQQQALTSASTNVGLRNQARFGLAQAQRDMRFGGM
jgi:hypothetical protein